MLLVRIGGGATQASRGLEGVGPFTEHFDAHRPPISQGEDQIAVLLDAHLALGADPPFADGGEHPVFASIP
jgi:hypothetical protein